MIALTIVIAVVCHIAAYAIFKWRDEEIEASNWKKRHDAAERRCAEQFNKFASRIKQEEDHFNNLFDYANELISLLDDADAEHAATSVFLVKVYSELSKALEKCQIFQDKASGLEMQLAKAQSEIKRYVVRPRCPKCHRFLKDGVCSNAKCQEQDAEPKPVDAPETFDSTVAAEYMKQGKVVVTQSQPPIYYWENGNDMIWKHLVNGSEWCCDINDLGNFVDHYRNELFTLATPADLTDAPFESLEGIKEGDYVLFSDGVVRKVVFVHIVTPPAMLTSAIKVNPSAGKKSNGCAYFNISDGKHWQDRTPIRAIRIATELDKKLYQFADSSKMIEKPRTAGGAE